MIFKKKTMLVLQALLLLFMLNNRIMASTTIIKNIKVEGLKRISLETFNTYLSIKEGDRVDSKNTPAIIRSLYKTGFFSDVTVSLQGNALIIKVEERKTIGAIDISGNKKITNKQLSEALTNAGFIEGHVFDDSVLSNIKQALVGQYNSFGYHNVAVESKVSQLERNRVSVKIIVKEGPKAAIKGINIVGNKAFSSGTLLNHFTLSPSRLWSFMTHSDEFSREKFESDLENLRSFYLDHGYLRFRIESSQTKITPNKKNIYIVINIYEGPLYRVSGWKLSGDFLGKEEEIRKVVPIKKGEIFSRSKLMGVNEYIGNLLGNFGYAKPNIEIEPVLDDVKKEVFLVIKSQPGKRFYVRRINFSGNTKTHESVLRREMRQHEGAVYSLPKINESKRRLYNLGYLQDVDSKAEPVPNHPNEIDLDVSVKETQSAGANVNAGWSDVDHFIYGASISDQNFLGTGKSVGLDFKHGGYSSSYSLNYFDPYYTENNISLGVQGYYQKTTSDRNHMTPYDTHAYGANVIFGVPFSDYNRINFGYGYEHMRLSLNRVQSQEIANFVERYGDVFDTLKLIAGWSYSRLNRAIFPTQGFANSLNLEVGVPLPSQSGKLEYYKVAYEALFYQPLTRYFTIRLNGNLGYGHGYGAMKSLPFFKNYFCGGIGTVRGYEANTLGPIDSFGNPKGGNVLGDVNFSLIFPNPFGQSVRTSIFFDAGNVFDDQFVLNEFRTSTGVQAEWRSPMGLVFTFSYAKPLNARKRDFESKFPGDRVDSFQFNIGASI